MVNSSGLKWTSRRFAVFAGALFVLLTSVASAGPIEDLQPGHWLEVKNLDVDGDGSIDVVNSRLDAKDPCPSRNCSYSGNLGVTSVMDAWNGAAFDSGRDRLLVWGGGHNAYGGNEIYAFDLDTLQWERLTEPSTDMSIPGGNVNSGVLGDGKPRARHVYNHIQYAPPPLDRLIIPGGCCTFGHNSERTNDVSTFHFGLGVGPAGWETNAIPDFNPPGNSAATAMSSAVHGTTGDMWIVPDGGGNKLARLVPDLSGNWNNGNHRWEENATTQTVPIYLTTAIDPTRNLLVSVGAYSGVSRLLVHDLSNPMAAGVNYAGSSTGDDTIENTGGPGFDFDTASDRFVSWRGGSQVYTLNPATWHWERVNAASGNSVTPTMPNANNTYGRFRYSRNKNVFVLVNRTNENVYIYKLSNGSGTPPPDPEPIVNISANPTSVTSGSNSTLTWTVSNATSCSASGAWSGSKNAGGGSEVISNISANATYSINCAGAGGSDSANATVTVQGTPPPTGNWADRSTAPGVVMATRFDTEADVTNWIAGSNGDHVSWDQNLNASGNGSLKFEIRNSDGASSGNWSRWLADDQREFAPGDEIFVQYRQYIPAFLATHAFQGGGGWKQSIISRHAASMNGVNQSPPYGSNQLNEIVLQNTNHRGLVQGYNRDSQGKFPPWDVSAATACSNTDFIYQNAVDRGPQNVGSACENDRARIGGLYSYYQQQPSGYVAGSPDPMSGGFNYYPNEWLTFQIHVVFGQYGGNSFDTQIKVYAARDGGQYELLIDRDDIDLGSGPNHDALWLLPYNTNRQPDSSRQNTFTNYDEVIVSTQFIPAPQASSGGGTGTAKSPGAPSSLVAQ